ncbi:SNO glutamine amidotransferase, partial [Salpingoeca rosetta]
MLFSVQQRLSFLFLPTRCTTSMMTEQSVRIGVLALQGAFAEHVAMLRRIEGVEAFEVRNAKDLEAADGLVIPGGESTTMGLIAERTGILSSLREFVSLRKKPVFGTCAGLIMLADSAKHMKEGGQPLLGGLNVLVDRNHFGSQLQSFETELQVSEDEGLDLSACHGVFIRAPVVLKTLGPHVKILARVSGNPEKAAPLAAGEERIVAVHQDHMLGTAFHPELTADDRWHRYFVAMVRRHNEATAAEEHKAPEAGTLVHTPDVDRDVEATTAP